MMRNTCLLLCLGLLSACDPTPEPVAPTADPVEPAAVAPAEAATTELPPREVPPALPSVTGTAALPAKLPAPVPAPVQSEVNAQRVVSPNPAPPVKPAPNLALDLSVPHELFEQTSTNKAFEELAPILPPLFVEEPEPVSPFQISGRLISNERVDDYWESIEGAELQFEFKQ